MKLEDMNNLTLGALFHDASYASATIQMDAKDALEDSKNDRELIKNWKQKLENLRGEMDAFLKGLRELELEMECEVQERKVS
jgi:hypothetical protein